MTPLTESESGGSERQGPSSLLSYPVYYISQTQSSFFAASRNSEAAGMVDCPGRSGCRLSRQSKWSMSRSKWTTDRLFFDHPGQAEAVTKSQHHGAVTKSQHHGADSVAPLVASLSGQNLASVHDLYKREATCEYSFGFVFFPSGMSTHSYATRFAERMGLASPLADQRPAAAQREATPNSD